LFISDDVSQAFWRRSGLRTSEAVEWPIAGFIGAGQSILVCEETGGHRRSGSLFWVSWSDGFGQWSYILNVLVVVGASRTLT